MISKETIFTGCDSRYWKMYGKPFVKSFSHFNPDKEVFVQIFNPDKSDIEDLKSLKCSFNAEEVDLEYINELVLENIKIFENDLDTVHRSRLKHGMKFSEKNYGYKTIEDKMRHLLTFATYASFRFIRLSELWTGQNPVAAYDIDTVCMKHIDINKMLNNNDAGCLSVKGDRFVVSLTAFRNNHPLLSDWGDTLKKGFDSKKVYGFLDQDSFVTKSKDYNVTKIDRAFCDHTSKSAASAYAMTGKGTSKFGDLFQTEQRKWV